MNDNNLNNNFNNLQQNINNLNTIQPQISQQPIYKDSPTQTLLNYYNTNLKLIYTEE